MYQSVSVLYLFNIFFSCSAMFVCLCHLLVFLFSVLGPLDEPVWSSLQLWYLSGWRTVCTCVLVLLTRLIPLNHAVGKCTEYLRICLLPPWKKFFQLHIAVGLVATIARMLVYVGERHRFLLSSLFLVPFRC